MDLAVTAIMRRELLTENALATHARMSAHVYGADAAVSKIEHLRWKYLDNPDGPAHSLVWYEAGEPVARVVALPRRFERDGLTIRAGFVVDFLVEPNRRSMPLLGAISKSLSQFSGFDFLYMTPNTNGIKFWHGLGKLKPVSHATVTALPLTPTGLVLQRAVGSSVARGADRAWQSLLHLVAGSARLLSNVSIDIVPADDPCLDLVDSWTTERHIIHRKRDAAFRRWRLNGNQDRRAVTAVFRCGGAYIGYAAWRDAEFQDYTARLIIDSAVAPDVTALQKIASLHHIMRADSTGPQPQLIVSIAHDGRGAGKLTRSFPLLRVPQRFLPQPIPLFVLPSSSAAALRPDDFAFTLADCDMF